jgi:hypothetical protein
LTFGQRCPGFYAAVHQRLLEKEILDRNRADNSPRIEEVP